jgi:hypothetical protein
VKERECAIEVIAVEWCRDDASRSLRVGGNADPIGTGIRSINAVCRVCNRRFRAGRAEAPGQPGFHAFVYDIMIACECGAVSAKRIEELEG